MERFEKIYIGNCEHVGNYTVEDRRCLKRYYRIFNPLIYQEQIFCFCNDYLKLNIHDIIIKEQESIDFCNSRYEYILSDFVKNKIYYEIGLNLNYSHKNSSVINDYLYFSFNLSMDDQLSFFYNFYIPDLISDSAFLFNLNIKNYYTRYRLFEEAGYHFRRLFIYMENKIKYKTLWQECNYFKKLFSERYTISRIDEKTLLRLNEFLCNFIAKV